MFNLLLVDDEVHIVDWLYDLFTEVTDLELEIFKAHSAFDALDWLSQTRIDIVLTDIRMPKMSGLELMENVLENWPRCKAIFLTGYDEFDFVYQAISHAGVSYLLKTEDDDAIIEAVRKAIHDLQLSDKQLMQADKQESLLRLLQYRQTVHNFIENGFHKQDQFRWDEYYSDIPLDPTLPALLVIAKIELNDYTSYFDTYAKIELLMRNQLGNRYLFVQVDYRKNQLVWIMQEVKPSSHHQVFLWNTLESVANTFHSLYNQSISFLIDSQQVSFQDIFNRMHILQYSVDYLIGDQRSVVVNVQDQELPDFNSHYDVTISSTESLRNYLELRREDDYFVVLKKATKSLRDVKSMYDMYAIEAYCEIALMILSHINRNHLQEKLMFSIGIGQLMRYRDFDDWKKGCDYLFQISRNIFELQRDESTKKSSHVIQLIIDYIVNNLDGDLSLTNIARAVHYNPSYLSRIFKQMMGTNLFQYIIALQRE